MVKEISNNTYFFTPVVTDGVSLVSELQQVTQGLQVFDKHLRQFLLCCYLNGFGSYSNFKFNKLLFHILGDSSKGTNYAWYPFHLYDIQHFFFQFSCNAQVYHSFSLSFTFTFTFTFWSAIISIIIIVTPCEFCIPS